MKHTSILISTFMLLAMLPACNWRKEETRLPEPVEYVSKEIEAKQDTIFTVQLPSNRTTGFAWKIESLDTNYLKVLDHSYQDTVADAKKMGQPGHEVWKLQALQKGTTTIELSYRQQWRTDTHGKLATITITII